MEAIDRYARSEQRRVWGARLEPVALLPVADALVAVLAKTWDHDAIFRAGSGLAEPGSPNVGS